MCTLTWHRREHGYELLFNRDELRSRKEALCGAVGEGVNREGRPVRFLAPTDGDFGGSWIAVNEAGLALGLLNGFRAEEAGDPREYRSRGLLLRDLAASGTVGEVLSRVRAEELRRYRPFRLLAIEAGVPALVAEWDGESVEIDPDADGRLPLISSSFEESEVGRCRREEFRRATAGGRVLSPERLAAFHRSHAHGPSAFSVCMHRSDAATRSFTRVRVDAAEVSLLYHPGSPCRESEETVLRLPRRPRPALCGPRRDGP